MDAGRRLHVELEGGRFLPVTFLGRELTELELAEALALLHDSLPARLAAHDGKTASPPDLLRGDTLECVIKILPAEPSYSIVTRSADGAYTPLKHAGPRLLCHVQTLAAGAPKEPPIALQRSVPGASVEHSLPAGAANGAPGGPRRAEPAVR
jgi:hypothetical protein